MSSCGTWIGYYVLVLNREAKQWKLTFISDLKLNCRQWMWDNSPSQRTYFLNGISSWNSVLLIKNRLWMHFLIETICDFEYYPSFSSRPLKITEVADGIFINKSSDLLRIPIKLHSKLQLHFNKKDCRKSI